MAKRGKPDGITPGKDLGRSLAVLRAARGLTQSGLARASGVRRQSICEFEAGLRAPDAAALAALLSAMGLSWGALDLARRFLGRLELEGGRSPGAAGKKAERRAAGAAEELSDLAGRLGEIASLLMDTPDGEGNPGAGGPPSAGDRDAARRFWRETKGLPRSVQEERLGDLPERSLWALAELLCLESQRLCAEHPARAKAAAEFALALAGQVPGDDLWRSKLLGFAWAHIGNALRVAGDLRGSERAFGTAERFWEEGAGAFPGLLEEGMVCALKASLRRAQRRMDESRELLERAAGLAGGRDFLAQVILSRAKLSEERGDLEQAAGVLREAIEAATPDGDARLSRTLRQNLADTLSKLGRHGEARELLSQVRKSVAEKGGDLDRIRLMWTEGRVAAGSGDLEAGIGLLVRVRGEFASRRMGYDMALVSLELAVLYAEAGRPADVQALARHMVPIFQAQEIHREALAALALFRQAAERKAVTAGFARSLAAYLHKARHDPGLRFSPSSDVISPG